MPPVPGSIKDLLGNDVTVGCRIAYATRAGSCTEISVATVNAIMLVSERYDPEKYRIKLRVTIDATSRYRADEIVGRSVTLECLDRIVVVGPQ